MKEPCMSEDHESSENFYVVRIYFSTLSGKDIIPSQDIGE